MNIFRKKTSDGLSEGDETSIKILREKRYRWVDNYADSQIWKGKEDTCLVDTKDNRMKIWFIFKNKD